MKQLSLLVLGSALVLGFGWAQDTSTDTSTAMTGGTMDFATFDADADGLISADELGQGLLTQYDTNADSSLDETEFAAISAGSATTDATSTDSASTDTSTDSSTDSASTDSSTSTDTATTEPSSMTLDFATFDADADGAVSAEELGLGMLASYDANADSGLDETEFAAVAAPSGTVNTQ